MNTSISSSHISISSSHADSHSSPSPAFSPETLAKAQDTLSKTIQLVASAYTAFTPLISAIRVVYSDVVPTLGVDEYARLVVNPAFIVENLPYAQGLFVHELLHLFFGHVSDSRTELAYTDNRSRNFLINVAEDCAINQIIEEPLPKSAVRPHALQKAFKTNDRIDTFETAEYYLNWIYAHQPDQENQPDQPHQPGASSSPFSSLQATDSTDEVNTQPVQDELDKIAPGHVSQEELNDAQMGVARNIVTNKGSYPGNGSGALATFALELLTPKVDWRPLLRTKIQNVEHTTFSIHQHTTFKRTSRRSSAVSRSVFLPRHFGHKLSVTMSFDTSGSISEHQVSQFLAEIKSCLKHSEIKEVALWHTSVYYRGTPQELEKNIANVFECGGTSSRCVEECAEHTKADIGFTFTDGLWRTDPVRTRDCKTKTMYAIIWNNDEIQEVRKLW